MPRRARVERRSCQSSGKCVEAAPEQFRFDVDPAAEFDANAAPLSAERLLAIARGCPALAISVFDADGDEVDF